MTKKFTLFKIKEIFIPDCKVIIQFAVKKDFMKWIGKGGVYVTEKPDDEGYHTFYAFDGTFFAINFKQKSDKL